MSTDCYRVLMEKRQVYCKGKRVMEEKTGGVYGVQYSNGEQSGAGSRVRILTTFVVKFGA